MFEHQREVGRRCGKQEPRRCRKVIHTGNLEQKLHLNWQRNGAEQNCCPKGNHWRNSINRGLLVLPAFLRTSLLKELFLSIFTALAPCKKHLFLGNCTSTQKAVWVTSSCVQSPPTKVRLVEEAYFWTHPFHSWPL